LQFHIMDYGIMQHILSDNGSPIVSSIRNIQELLDDTEITNFLVERDIQRIIEQ